mgnify:CR=1 FL=1
MSDLPADPQPVESDERPSWWQRSKLLWPGTEKAFTTFLIILLLGLSVSMLLLLTRKGAWVPQSLRFLLDNLPLTLPILSVSMGIMLKPYELRQIRGWLSLSNHFAAGLVSFSIWAFVAGQSVEQFIPINPDNVLDKDFALLLVFGSFIWAGFCSVITALAEITTGTVQRVWRTAQALLVGVSITFMIAPFQLFESKESVEARTGRSLDEQQFTVVIPFRDPALNQHIGRSSDPITQAQVYRGIAARTSQQAIMKAVSQFLESDMSIQFTQPGKKPDPTRRVELLETYMVAAPTP